MAKISLLFYGLLFAIAITSTLCESTVSYVEEEQHESPLSQAMAVINMISRINEFKGRALRTFPDPVKALGELTLFGAFKIGFFLISGLVVLSGFFPSLLAAFGISAPFLVRSVTEGVGDLKNLNYEMVSHSIRSLPDKSFEALDVKGDDCRSRAVCEIGEYGARAFPTLSGYVRAFGNKFSFNDKYMVGLIKGMSKANCAKAFESCPQSPFKKLTYLSTYNIF